MLNYFGASHLYTAFEMQRAVMGPLNAAAQAGQEFFKSPLNPLAYGDAGRNIAAGYQLMERLTRKYMRPDWRIDETEVKGKRVRIGIEKLHKDPFCTLVHFKKDIHDFKGNQPKMLIVAPMSGHYATLLRGTVEGLLPHADVYITEWLNASDVPMSEGDFNLEDYIEYVQRYIALLGEDVHVMAVCQPAVPVFAAVALSSAEKNGVVPKSMTLIGGPIDPRKSPTEPNRLAEENSYEWFEQNVITVVPFNYPGFMRRVYPGFLQLTGFMQMNLDRHMQAHVELYNHLVEGDGDSTEKHEEFYDEYLAVMDITAEFYLQTIKEVFQEYSLPRGKMTVKGKKVDPGAIKKTAVLAIEGEKDDISGIGQTKAALDLCKNLAKSKKKYHLQKAVGHYGTFNGRRYREHIVPVIVDFMKKSS